MSGRKIRVQDLPRFLNLVKETSLRYDGSAMRTMLRNDAYWFSRLGVYVERADNTARVLDVKYHVLLPQDAEVGGGGKQIYLTFNFYYSRELVHGLLEREETPPS